MPACSTQNPNTSMPSWTPTCCVKDERGVDIDMTVDKIQRVPTLREFWDLKKTVLRKIRVSGTVRGPQLTQKSPTLAYISQK